MNPVYEFKKFFNTKKDHEEILDQFFTDEKFNMEEILGFMRSLMMFTSDVGYPFIDELYNFMVYSKIIDTPTTEVEFLNFLKEKFNFNNKKILDVGAGRTCKLAQESVKLGATATAIDPRIRFSNKEASDKKISIIKKYFACDEFSYLNSGTKIKKYDKILALHPCDATEHIIRQCLKYDKAFYIALCGESHPTLYGEEMRNADQWYKYFKGLSSSIKIKDVETPYIDLHIASNEL